MTFVQTTRRGTVAVVTLTRPPANVMDAAGLDELSDEIERLGTDPDVGGIVITGDGRVFSAGLDLKAIGALDSAGQEALIEALNRAFLAVYACPRLVVGAINGHAIAGGLVLALCCDVRLVADVALRAALAEVSVGVVFPVGAIEVVRNELAGAARRRLVLRGEIVDGESGVELGVFDRRVPAADLLETAVAEAADTRPLVAFAAHQGAAAPAGHRADAGGAGWPRSVVEAVARTGGHRRRCGGATSVTTRCSRPRFGVALSTTTRWRPFSEWVAVGWRSSAVGARPVDGCPSWRPSRRRARRTSSAGSGRRRRGRAASRGMT